MNRLICGAVCTMAFLGATARAAEYTIPVTGFSVLDTDPAAGSCGSISLPSFCLVTQLQDAYLHVVVPSDDPGIYSSYISATFYINGVRRSGFKIGDSSTDIGFGPAYAWVTVGNDSISIFGRDGTSTSNGLIAFYEGSSFRVVTNPLQSGVQTYSYEIFATLGTPVVSGVPEPAVPALMLAGLSLFGLARTRRRR